ncbi:MAG: peptidoglycan DD-metalloendopeptidase family protein [Bacteroidales bacterium]|nr:peptidoglycan DD-metalloendopeptidase family protein [Bacteroidales bacterium]
MLKPTFRIYSIISLIVVMTIVILIAFWIPDLLKKNPPIRSKPISSGMVYKIKLDSLQVSYGTVANNENLSDILSPVVSGQIIDKIAKETREIFDVRKLHTGNRYAFITTRDTAHKTLYFVYEINQIDFVVYDFRDSLNVYKDKKRVNRLIKSAQGTITSSLWNCFIENRLDINLGLALSDVYAWNVDFYGLQKGDHFKVIYEELFVDKVMIGIDKILGSVFTSGGKDYYAFYFDQGVNGSYFDENGQSLQRTFLKAPLKFSRISSRFSKARMHPILRIFRPHFGVDYSAPRGTPVVALGDGRVTEVGWHGGFGRYIGIRHNSSFATSYAHLSGYAPGIKPGNQVKQGEIIGFVGSSGLSTGAHLDFRVYQNGKPTDPLKLVSPPATPVAQSSMVQFQKLTTGLKLKLDSIH